jgi:LPLT family lysophospholipid transporter-like MFS transporter
MLTLLAILGGLWGGATLYDHTRSLPACYAASVGLYAAALVLNALMSRTPSNPEAQLSHSITAFGNRLASLIRQPRLSRVLLGCGLFWFAGAVLRSNLQGWGLETLASAGVTEITNQKLALLKIGLIAGVVAGSLLAGVLHQVSDLSWARRYGFMLAASVLLLGAIGGAWGVAVAAFLLLITGLTAGLLLIPLNAALQHEGDHTTLGKTIAVQNFVDYLSMLIGAGFLQVLTHFGFMPNRVFVALAIALALLSLILRFSRVTPAPRS